MFLTFERFFPKQCSFSLKDCGSTACPVNWTNIWKKELKMSSQNVRCPICGCLNKGLALNETLGWMECIKCKTVVQVQPGKYVKRVPVISMKEVSGLNKSLGWFLRRFNYE